MAKITFITTTGESITVEADSGSIMELAVNHTIPGIEGDCGGVCSCATCHVHVAPEDMDKVGNASEIERDMLELDDNANEYSRLGCQIPVVEALNGITLKIAEKAF